MDARPVFWKEVHFHPLLVKAKQHRTANRLAAVLLVGVPAAAFFLAAVSDLGGYAVFVKEISRYYLMLVAWRAVVKESDLPRATREKFRGRITYNTFGEHGHVIL